MIDKRKKDQGVKHLTPNEAEMFFYYIFENLEFEKKEMMGTLRFALTAHKNSKNALGIVKNYIEHTFSREIMEETVGYISALNALLQREIVSKNLLEIKEIGDTAFYIPPQILSKEAICKFQWISELSKNIEIKYGIHYLKKNEEDNRLEFFFRNPDGQVITYYLEADYLKSTGIDHVKNISEKNLISFEKNLSQEIKRKILVEGLKIYLNTLAPHFPKLTVNELLITLKNSEQDIKKTITESLINLFENNQISRESLATFYGNIEKITEKKEQVLGLFKNRKSIMLGTIQKKIPWLGLVRAEIVTLWDEIISPVNTQIMTQNAVKAEILMAIILAIGLSLSVKENEKSPFLYALVGCAVIFFLTPILAHLQLRKNDVRRDAYMASIFFQTILLEQELSRIKYNSKSASFKKRFAFKPLPMPKDMQQQLTKALEKQRKLERQLLSAKSAEKAPRKGEKEKRKGVPHEKYPTTNLTPAPSRVIDLSRELGYLAIYKAGDERNTLFPFKKDGVTFYAAIHPDPVLEKEAGTHWKNFLYTAKKVKFARDENQPGIKLLSKELKDPITRELHKTYELKIKNNHGGGNVRLVGRMVPIIRPDGTRYNVYSFDTFWDKSKPLPDTFALRNRIEPSPDASAAAASPIPSPVADSLNSDPGSRYRLVGGTFFQTAKKKPTNVAPPTTQQNPPGLAPG